MFEIFTFPQFPQNPVFAAYFINVSNQKHIRDRLLAADPAYNYAFVNGDYLLTLEQVLSAVYKTLLDDSFDRKKSKSVNTEIIYNLSPLKNILECLKTFGITDSPQLLVIKILNKDDDPETIYSQLQQLVEGTPTQLSDQTLQTYADAARVRKLFKIQESDLARLSRTLIANTQLKTL
ncbi:hypothetical protein OGATHE_001654 [Ogataea polymorpha]|uniref:EKC/KEOPS complex subunit CGI121 n=1 Tax=Ogataea polymorpha TaxID=460523 RepID=A0A9P8PQ66_9ASCO|nr:hypothetical protein OGATHE_001654 [Ogataea polymorpha]